VIEGGEITDYDVFVSYSSKDKQIADAVAVSLEAARTRCWIAPRDIRPGADWGASIIEAISKCRIMVLIYSGHSNESRQVLREVERAVGKGLTIIPLRVDGTPMSANMEYFISASHWLDALTGPRKEHLAQLVQTVNAMTAEMDADAIRRAAQAASDARLLAELKALGNSGKRKVRPAGGVTEQRQLPATPKVRPAANAVKDPGAKPAHHESSRAARAVLWLTVLLVIGAVVAFVCPWQDWLTSVVGSTSSAPPQNSGSNPLLSTADFTSPTLQMKFARIMPGEFTMGSAGYEEGHNIDETQHQVKLTRAFFMGIHHVTRGDFRKFVMDDHYKTDAEKANEADTWIRNKDFAQDDSHPVVNVSWNDAKAFVGWLNRKEHRAEGNGYRLPTEAEWEYACRAGTSTRFNTGSYVKSLESAGWYRGNSGFKTHPVGQKQSNAFGLYDMHGNARQWCDDAAYAAHPVADPISHATDSQVMHRVRGASWNDVPDFCRSAFRNVKFSETRTSEIGFRVVLDCPQSAPVRSFPSTVPAKSWGMSPGIVASHALGMKFVRIEPGSFIMGSPDGEAGRDKDENLHKVILSRGFRMAATHVTRGQFAAFVAETLHKTDAEREGKVNAVEGGTTKPVDGASWRNPGFEQTDDHPVVLVSWNDAIAFCAWLSTKDHTMYRLPTEAEWEYACRAGTQTAYFWGDDPDGGQGYANCADLTGKERFPKWTKAFNWHDGFVFTSPAGAFKPNKFGLHDMIGNAWGWCSDYYAPYPEGDAMDPTGPRVGDKEETRVLRGGSWGMTPAHCRAAQRRQLPPTHRSAFIGFRICLDL
jgi:formylglycine-generating enzyme required for sulfatase activity